MAAYFPDSYRGSFYETLFASFHPREQVLIGREFLGVSLRRPLRPRTFEMYLAQHNRVLTLPRFMWRYDKQVIYNYLKLVLRHYVFGATVLLTKIHLGQQLQAPSPGCVHDAHAMTASLINLNQHQELLDSKLDVLLAHLLKERVRHYYILCIVGFAIARELFSRSAMEKTLAAMANSSLPGSIPMGVELEFSNLGHEAPIDTTWANPSQWGRWRRDPAFHNMRLYHCFHLDHVSWRLGGYLDHHVGWRKYKPVPFCRVGGFMECCLVRTNYQRSSSLPYTTDTGLLSQTVEALIDYFPDVAPFSMHLNLEQTSSGLKNEPMVDDYICLFILGGDFGPDEQGKLMERRLGRDEIRGLAHRNKHYSSQDRQWHTVVEFGIVRLWRRHERPVDMQTIILTLKGFLGGYRIRQENINTMGALLRWAGTPCALDISALQRFCRNVAGGLLELGETVDTQEFEHRLLRTLQQRQQELFG
ncbi:hypothetical protein [Desulfurispira natronophila]|uniref:Uncharacterized protein n=1 Tax=Desulfurispira natronophila TaxID=682562 RepID=A0A7W7Y2Z0_9BACT|nr:hypothetical protein [Desulfurispira natronophila]MBB5021131.1 hypothetical protein [Desulfurispira natronophila]